MRRSLIALVVMLLHVHAAWADYAESEQAFRAKDYPTALKKAQEAADDGDARAYLLLGQMYQAGWGVEVNPQLAVFCYNKAAQAGVSGAYAKLAWAYARGSGVEKDTGQGLEWAQRSARSGNAEGWFVTYVILQNEHLMYLNPNGKVDEQRYRTLAERSLDERTLDTEAYDALYQAAQKNHPPALVVLAAKLAGTVGEGNLQRFLDTLQKISPLKPAALQTYEKVADHMQSVGSSYASPQLFVDAQSITMLAASIKACGKDHPKSANTLPSLVETKISHPLADAVFLPSEIPGYEKAFLISGWWEEEWRYQACNNNVPVQIKFIADGLGGAKFTATEPVSRE